ncbi:MAG: phage tail tape measure protein [Clostridia bacterium]|nr:phage tail tape measure protein [Clostridia bacterium]
MSSKIQGITVEIGGDTTKLGNALKGVNKEAKDLQSELKGVNTLLKMDPGNVTLLKQKQDLLNQSISECKEKLNILKTTQEQVQTQFEKGEITQEQYRDFQREIVATETKLQSLTKELKNFGTVGVQQVAAVGEKMKETGEKITSAGKQMLGATAGITAIGAAAVITGTNFDDSMKQVAATMGITVDEISKGSEEYKILENAAKQCGETTKFSASEAAEALNYLALAGYDAQKSAEVLPKVLDLAAAGGLELATASDMVTDAMAALGMETSALDKYIDEMAKTSQKSNTSAAQLGEATLTCAGTVKMSGMSLETMNAELGVLANNGIKGAEGGTHLRNIILSLTSPTDIASKALKNLGINILDSQGNIRDLNDIMTDFDSKLSGLSDGQKTEIISTIFNKTDISAVNALIKGSGEEFSNLKNEISNCSGAASNMADTMNSSMGGQITLLKSQLEGIAIQISEILMPVLQKIIDKVSGLLNWISKLSPTAKTIIVVIAGIVAAIGPLLIIVGKVVSSIGAIITYGPQILSAIGVVKSAVSGLFTTLMANPIVLIVAAIAALIAIFVTLWNKCEWFRNFWIGLWEGIKSVFSVVINFVKNQINNFIAFVSTIANFINTYVIQPIWNSIQNFLNMIQTIVDWINTNVIQPVLNVVVPIVQKIQEIASKIWEIITTIFGAVCQWIYDNMIEPTLNTIMAFKTAVENFFQNIWNTIVNIFSSIANWFAEQFNKSKESIIAVFTPIIEWFQNVWNGIKNAFNTVVQFFR